MRSTVARTQEAMATEWAALNMEAWVKRRMRTFEDAERGLVFGRLTLAASSGGGAAGGRPGDPAAGGGGAGGPRRRRRRWRRHAAPPLRRPPLGARPRARVARRQLAGACGSAV